MEERGRWLRWTFPVGLLQCNCTMVADPVTRQALVIDPGDQIERIAELLASHRLTVAAIAITHAHIDHIGGAARLKALTGAPVLLRPDDLQIYNMIEEQAAWIGVPPPERTAIDGGLSEGVPVRAGGLVFDVLATPGHTPGSVCLYAPSERHLFAGDTLFAGSIGRTDLPGGDTARILHSIHGKLLALPDDTIVIPGHGPETTIGRERRSNPFLIS